jgi:hypothetical protein
LIPDFDHANSFHDSPQRCFVRSAQNWLLCHTFFLHTDISTDQLNKNKPIF